MEYVLEIMPFLFEGFKLSLKIYLVTLIFALPLAVFAAIGKVSGPPLVKRLLNLYTWIWRGTPLLLQLFFIYFGLPAFGLNIQPFMAAAIGFILNITAYLTEIIRGGIESIDKGQYEAAKSLGLSYPQTMRRIILPQIIKRILPPSCSEAIILFKDTSLLAAIAMGDLLRSAKEIVTTDFKITAFVVVFLIYLVVSSMLVQLFGRLEEKYSYYE